MGEMKETIIEGVTFIASVPHDDPNWGKILSVDIFFDSKPIWGSDKVIGVGIQEDIVKKVELYKEITRITFKEPVVCHAIQSWGEYYIRCAKSKEDLEKI